MSGDFSGFTQARISRAIRAVSKAGQQVARVIILRDGTVTLELTEQPPAKESKVAA